MRTFLLAMLLILMCTACTQSSHVLDPTPAVTKATTAIPEPVPVPVPGPVPVPMYDLSCATRDTWVRAYLLDGGARNTIWTIRPDMKGQKVFLQDNGSTLGAAWFDYPDRWCVDPARPGLAYEEERCTEPKWPYRCEH